MLTAVLYTVKPCVVMVTRPNIYDQEHIMNNTHHGRRVGSVVAADWTFSDLQWSFVQFKLMPLACVAAVV